MSTTAIEHIVLFKVKDDTDPSKVNTMLTSLNALVSLDPVLHLAAAPLYRTKSSPFPFTHMLHSRYSSKDSLNAYSAHPSHVTVVKESVLPICDDIMAVDWVADDLQGPIVPPPGSAIRVSFLKLKENLGEEDKDEILAFIKGIKGSIGEINQLSCGGNFSPARAKGYSIASLAVFPGVSGLEAVDSNEELVNLQKEKETSLGQQPSNIPIESTPETKNFYKTNSVFALAMDDLVLYSVGLSLLLLLVLYGAGRVSYSIWWKPKLLERKLKQQGIKGTHYKVLLGDMKDYIRMITEAWSKPMNLTHQIVQRVDPFTLHVVQNYGKTSMFWNGKTPRLIISNPELMKEILLNKLGHIQKPPINPLILILARGLTVLEGEKWAIHRRLINPAFHLEKLKGMVPVFAMSCKEMIDQWKKKLSDEEICEVDVWPELQRTAKDIISRAAFGSNYEQGKKIFQLQHELMMLTMEAMQTLYIPGFRFVPTKKNQRRNKLNIEITSMLRDMVEKKQNEMRTGRSRVDDLLSLLLHSSEQQNSSGTANSTVNNGLTIEEIIEECKVFYLAGQETTSCLLTWTMIVLAMHPDWQEKAREEVLQICGNEEPDFEALTHLKIVTMILNEVLRLYPPAIALYQHTCKETKIGDITIPAGVDLILPTMLIHRDPEFWGEDAEEFRPDRFSEGISKASKDHLAFFPFGWGPRICIGQNFAMLEAKVALAMILQNFSLELSPSYTHAPCTVMLLQPQHGAQIFIRRL